MLRFKKEKKPNIGERINQENDNAVPIKELIPGMAMHFAGCCHPLPGDKIVGVIHTGSGVTIHTSDCEMLNNFASQASKIIDLTWDSDASKIPAICRLKIIMHNEPGSLAALTSEIAQGHGNITNLKITDRSPDFFEVIFDIEVHNSFHMDNIIHSLQANKTVHLVEKYSG